MVTAKTLIIQTKIFLTSAPKVISQSKDSLITAFGLYTLAKYHTLKGSYKTAEELILKSIVEYGDHLIVPTSCEGNAERKTSLIMNIKNLSFILYQLGGWKFKSEMSDAIRNICDNINSKKESQAIACDIGKNLNGTFWGDRFIK
jgi:hypothetical protein